MRSIAWSSLGGASAVALGTALAGLIALGAAGAYAQGYGYARDGFRGERLYYRPLAPVPRARRYYYRSEPRARACGQFHYRRNGRCVDARDTPPDLR